MFKSASVERNPFSSLILLLLLIFAGAVIFTSIAFVIGFSIYGMESMLQLSSGEIVNLDLIKLVQIVSSIGMFVVPALVYAKLQNKDWLGYLKIIPVPGYLALITIVIMFSSSPALEYIMQLNKGMKLPYFLKEVEAWMLQQELKMEEMTKQLIIMNSVPELLVNLIMLALIPAFGEELIFRAGFQGIFARWFGNYHVAIWLTAIIFSSIHFQFYGFFPRMFLGALFGYLLVWSGSLWLPILGHFLNNAIAVITAYWYQKQGLSIDKMFESEPSSPVLISISFILFIVSMRYFYRYTRKLHEINRGSLDGSRMG
ncbi:MAG: CPBP family intramembrane metalloprotease [Daejeonella sp.]|uniref:CPBP family intramembrane glutamic endopeptidase n=1 Tax=Daejeonella sp. TaxID=2805397 RepID=UPI0027367DCF|nr:CPBP family intramembrane glutamic endopeptidase [Daejeonella sp.]MDP3467119.1 CPBP family intramembrane metalloprotease [Daejeonella sp.]